MPIVRFPLSQPIESRTNSLLKDSYSKNCYFETRNQTREIIKRPGTITFPVSPALSAGQAQGLFAFNGNLFACTNNTLYQITPVGASSTIGTVTGVNNPISFNQTATVPYMTLHNMSHLYTVTTTGTFAVASQLDTILSAIGLSSQGLVRGIVYLDGTTYVMTTTGRIYNSAVEDPTTWNSLNFISAEAEPDAGVGIVKHFNYLVAFGQWSTEFFYDAANATGSPLSRADSYRLEIGCANGGSIVQIEQSLIWVGKSKEHGKSVYIMEGLSPVKVSTSYIERYLNADQTDDVKAYAFKIEGHTFYVMCLHNTDLTFVYDMDQKQWYNWSISVLTPFKFNAVSGTAISGKAVAGVAVDTPGSASEHYFRATFYTEFNSNYYAIDDDSALIYTINPNAYTDSGQPIYFKVVTDIMDFGTTNPKFYRRLEIVGDKVAGTMYVRHSDDDYQTWSTYRSIDLSASRSQIYLSGADRRRAWEFLCTSNVALRLDGAEIDFRIGEMDQEQQVGGGRYRK